MSDEFGWFGNVGDDQSDRSKNRSQKRLGQEIVLGGKSYKVATLSQPQIGSDERRDIWLLAIEPGMFDEIVGSPQFKGRRARYEDSLMNMNSPYYQHIRFLGHLGPWESSKRGAHISVSLDREVGDILSVGVGADFDVISNLIRESMPPAIAQVYDWRSLNQVSLESPIHLSFRYPHSLATQDAPKVAKNLFGEYGLENIRQQREGFIDAQVVLPKR